MRVPLILAAALLAGCFGASQAPLDWSHESKDGGILLRAQSREPSHLRLDYLTFFPGGGGGQGAPGATRHELTIPATAVSAGALIYLAAKWTADGWEVSPPIAIKEGASIVQTPPRSVASWTDPIPLPIGASGASEVAYVFYASNGRVLSGIVTTSTDGGEAYLDLASESRGTPIERDLVNEELAQLIVLFAEKEEGSVTVRHHLVQRDSK